MGNEPLYNVSYVNNDTEDKPTITKEIIDNNKIFITKTFKGVIHNILLEYDSIQDETEKREFIRSFE